MAKATTGRDAGDKPGGRQTIYDQVGGIAQGAEVLTLDGALPVEYLMPGDRVITRTGARKIVRIHVTTLRGPMIAIRPGSLGHNRPERQLLLAPQTRVMLRDWRAMALYGAKTVMVPVSRLADGEFIAPVAGAEVQLFSLEMECPEVIYVDGVEVGIDGAMVTA